MKLSLRLACCPKTCNKDDKNLFMFHNGIKKLNKELDIKHIIYNTRKMNKIDNSYYGLDPLDKCSSDSSINSLFTFEDRKDRL